MARQTKWTEKKIADLAAQGCGSGSGANYSPWIEVTGFSSLGRSRRVWSPKTQRVHHLLSDVEYEIFLASEWSRSVTDIREQYPLDREITQTVAQQLKIAHPHYPGTKVPTVMTVDFLLTVIDNGSKRLVALNAKTDAEAEDSRSLEKLEIQRSYFEQLGVDHHLMYESQLPSQKLKNIAWIRDAQLKDGELEPVPGHYASFCPRMSKELASASLQTDITLSRYCASFDERYGLEAGSGLRVARMLMQERSLMAKLESKDITQDSLASLVMTPRAGGLAVVGGK